MYILRDELIGRLSPLEQAEYKRLLAKATAKVERRMAEAEQFPVVSDSAIVGQFAAINLCGRWYSGIIVDVNDDVTLIMNVISRDITKMPGIEFGTANNGMRICWKTKAAFKLNTIATVVYGLLKRSPIRDAVMEVSKQDERDYQSTRLRLN